MPALVPEAFPDRLGEVVRRTAAKLGPEVGNQLLGLVSPQSLGIIAAFLVAWVVGHAFGIGEIIDIVAVVVGVFSVGLAVFSGLDELYEFGRLTLNARSNADLDAAAAHLAKAVAILGVATVIAVLTKGAAKNYPRGGRPIEAGPEPVRTPGLRYKPPPAARDPFMPAGAGETDFWGNVTLSTKGGADVQEVARLHEAFHQFLAPKLYLLRRFRVENRINSYFNSSLYRYIEEAIAETIGQVGVHRFKNAFSGFSFPVDEGYVFVTAGGGFDALMAGKGIRPEAASVIAAGVVQGFGFQVWLRSGRATPAASRNAPPPARARAPSPAH